MDAYFEFISYFREKCRKATNVYVDNSFNYSKRFITGSLQLTNATINLKGILWVFRSMLLNKTVRRIGFLS